MPTLTDPAVIKELLQRHGFSFSRALGQNFIINPGVCPKMAELGGAAQLRHFGAYAGVDDKILPQRAGKGKPMALQQLLDDGGIGKCGHGGLLAG